MPTLAPKPCVDCAVLVSDGTTRCPAHKRKAWANYSDQPARPRGRANQRKRAALFSREPLCRECLRQGITTVATIRDHVVPLAEGGTDVDGNVQPLCKACHDAKTARESLRGRGVQKSSVDRADTDPQAKFLRAGVTGEGGVKSDQPALVGVSA